MKVYSLVMILFSCLLPTVSQAQDYEIGSFNVITKTFAGGVPTTYFRFTITDADYLDICPIENVVTSATVTLPDSTTVSVITPTLNSWMRVEQRSTDSNRNGIIVITGDDSDEFAIVAARGREYEILSSQSPHAAGEYKLEVQCHNGQDLEKTISNISAGMDATAWPPVSDLAAQFDESTDLINLSWTLPTVVYPPGALIEIRINRFKQNFQKRYILHRVRNLPSNLSVFSLSKFESEDIKFNTPYINVKVNVYDETKVNMAQTTVMEYAVNDDTLIPAVILSITGDLDNDTDVDGADLVIFANSFGL